MTKPHHSHAAQVPVLVSGYFGPGVHPIVRQTFRPGGIWRNTTYRPRVNVSLLTKLRREGITHVNLTDGVRHVDFTIAEILKQENRPMFTGRLA